MKSIKRLGKCLVLCFCLLVTCAWNVKLDYSLDVKNNKSAEFEVILGLDEEFINALISLDGTNGEREYTEEEKWQLLEAYFESENLSEGPKSKGFTQSRYSENQYMGLKFTKKLDDIDNLIGNKISFSLEEFTEISDKILFIKEGNTYRTKLNLVNVFDLPDITFESKFVVTLPTKPLSHNATLVSEDGKTLTWNWVVDSGNIVEFEFKFSQLWLFIIIGVVVLLVGAGVAYVITKRRGPKRSANTVTTFDNTDNKKIIDNLTPNIEPKVEEKQSEQEVLEVEEILDEKPEVLTITPIDNGDRIINPGESVSKDNETTSGFESLDDEEVVAVELPEQEGMVDIGKVFPGEKSQASPAVKEFKSRPSTFEEFSNIFNNDVPTGADRVDEPVVSGRFFAPSDIPQPVVDKSLVTVESIFPTENALPSEANFVESTGASKSTSAEVLFPTIGITQASDVADLEKTTFANNLTAEIYQELDKKQDKEHKFFN